MLQEKKPIIIDQRVGVMIDGNNLELGIHDMYSKNHVINFDEFVPNVLKNRKLSYLHYFREGKSISKKLAERLQNSFFGNVTPCYKSADIAITIQAVQLVDKVDTIILCSGDSDYIPLIEHLKSRGIRVEIASTEIGLSNYVARKADSVYIIKPEDCFCLYENRPERGVAKCFDKFDEELKAGDVVDVQSVGQHKIYIKEDGELYFKPYGEEEKVVSYFKNDIIKV
jgi:uncharacterized protein (TIGR00288 family)